ncbi:MAG TPA: hypothetical protein VFJ85_04845 [Acidimicrobiales bacterium]|nr:hypothetical protein [Acidimicrobiales bacterium]
MGWLAAGERRLDGACGDGFLQGILLSEISAPCYTLATERRIVMCDDVERDRRGNVDVRSISLEVPWSRVCAYWVGVMPFPPDMWRHGHEGRVVMFTLEPEVADGKDIVVWPNEEAWTAAARAMGVPELRD